MRCWLKRGFGGRSIVESMSTGQNGLKPLPDSMMSSELARIEAAPQRKINGLNALRLRRGVQRAAARERAARWQAARPTLDTYQLVMSAASSMTF
eukprot:COSAG04_NODE_2198_length_4550_cov_171.247360_4_plen_95_part_00